MSTTNDELAQQLAGQAREAARKRRALLVASVALSSTQTIAAARRELADYDGPAAVIADALAALDELAAGDAADLGAVWQAATAPLVPGAGYGDRTKSG
jgi:hypothetical protein